MSEREAWQVTDDAAVLYERSFVPALFGRFALVLADAADIGPGQRVLDVGCGTGVVAREAARRVGPEGGVVGLDLNPRMLAVARRVAPEIEWRQGDAGDLPFDDGAFDVVVSQFAAMFFPDPALGLREMWRVLAPRGRLAVAVCGPLAAAAGYRALAEVAKRVCSPEVLAMLRSPFALGDERRLAGLVAQAGIESARIVTRACAVEFPSIDALVHTEVRASPIRDVIDARSFEALIEGARQDLAGFRSDRGDVRFGISAHVITARKA
ncbi:MAG TPA: methyltransferase domain-containing protein [Geminicoccaceae bacterium]|jgi:SAM-dependent methyltransferase|nr:methyltransferase domain-containing protein [Geminicoccaceae bacterium]